MKNDVNSILFGEDGLTNSITKNKKKSNNKQEKAFVNLVLDLENRNDLFKGENVVFLPKVNLSNKKEKSTDLFFAVLMNLFSFYLQML